MSLRIQNNVEAFAAHRYLSQTSDKAATAMERLSSGYRINRAADDAAGMAISEALRSQVGGAAQAQRNAQDGISLVQTAEGALTEVHAMLQRIRDLKVQNENGTLNTDDKAAIDKEVVALGDEISDVIAKTEFNDIPLLGAAAGSTVTFQIGGNAGETIVASTANLDTGNLGVVTGAASAAGMTFAQIDGAIKEISTRRADLGAVQNRLEHRLSNLATYQENLTSSESRIRDVDMAEEMVEFSKLQILQQAGTAMLSQANQAPQGVLSLLK